MKRLIAKAGWTLQQQVGHEPGFRIVAGRRCGRVSRLPSIPAFKGRFLMPLHPQPERRPAFGHARAGPQRGFAKASWTLLAVWYVAFPWPPVKLESSALQLEQARPHHDVVWRDGGDAEALEQVGGQGERRQRDRRGTLPCPHVRVHVAARQRDIPLRERVFSLG